MKPSICIAIVLAILAAVALVSTIETDEDRMQQLITAHRLVAI